MFFTDRAMLFATGQRLLEWLWLTLLFGFVRLLFRLESLFSLSLFGAISWQIHHPLQTFFALDEVCQFGIESNREIVER